MIEEEIHKMGLTDVAVKTPFDQQDAEKDALMMAIPVGDKPDDEVLPGIQDKWRDFFFVKVIENCAKERVWTLLQYRYQAMSAVERAVFSVGRFCPPLVGSLYGGIRGRNIGLAGIIYGIIVGATRTIEIGGFGSTRQRPPEDLRGTIDLVKATIFGH